MKTQLIFLCLLLQGIVAFSQDKRGNVWIFGDSVGIDFNSGAPVVFDNPSHNPLYYSTSVADTNGNLLAYISVQYPEVQSIDTMEQSFFNFSVYNAAHQRIDTSFRGRNNPHLISFKDNKLHLVSMDKAFSVSGQAEYNRHLFFYHRVNLETMQTEVKNRILYQTPGPLLQYFHPLGLTYAEYIIPQILFAKHANGRDWWIYMFRDLETIQQKYYQFLMTPDTCVFVDTSYVEFTVNIVTNRGLVTHGCGQDYLYLPGFTGDSLKTPPYYPNKTVIRYKLNRENGKLDSLPEIIQPPSLNNKTGTSLSLAVSPSQKYLYFTYAGFYGIPDLYLYQCDLEAGSPAQISASCQPIFFTNQNDIRTMKLGPDGKIYLFGGMPGNPPLSFTTWNADNMNLSVIHQPDSPGVACQFQLHGLSLNGRRSFGMFPNIPDYHIGPCTPQVADCGPAADTVGSGVSRQLGLLPQAGLQYSWAPADFLSDPNIANPVLTAPNLDTTITYILTITDPSSQSCCNQTRDSIQVTISRTVSRADAVQFLPLEMYPNPAENQLTVTTPAAGKLQIVNALGQVVYVSDCLAGKQVLNVSEFPAGLYLVQFQNPSFSATGKVVLKK